MDYGYVLRRAWEIINKFKVLWIFGILAGCGQTGTSGLNNSGYRFSSQDNNFPPQIERFFNQLTPEVITTLVIVGIIIALILIVLAVLLGTIGRIGLIRGTMKAEQGAERLTFGELWKEGLAYFWRVFGLNLLIGLIIFVAFLILIVPGAILTGLTGGIFAICLIPLICLIIPVMWAVTVWIEQANIALVVENLSIGEALQRGWQVFRNNIGAMIVMALILGLGIGLIGGIIIGLPLLLVGSPALVGYAKGTADAIRNGWIISGILFIIYLPFLLLLSGILKAYISSSWTLTYLRLTAKPAPPTVEVPGPSSDIIPPPL